MERMRTMNFLHNLSRVLILASAVAVFASSAHAELPSPSQLISAKASEILTVRNATSGDAAVVGGGCTDEGTLNSLTDQNPLICEKGLWEKVKFKSYDDGFVGELFYAGKCDLRLTDEGAHHVTMTVLKKNINLVDICLPVGYRPVVIATSNTQWLMENVRAIPNLLLLKAKGDKRVSYYLYARKPDGTLADKFTIDISSK
jgi:hypothetical protein